jgi:predicted transcriptional regulator
MPAKEFDSAVEVFLHDKPARILLGMRDSRDRAYASTLAKIADCTYSHTVKILEFFRKAGLVAFEKKGRVKYIKLTSLGETVANDIDSLLKKLKKIDGE